MSASCVRATIRCALPVARFDVAISKSVREWPDTVGNLQIRAASGQIRSASLQMRAASGQIRSAGLQIQSLGNQPASPGPQMAANRNQMAAKRNQTAAKRNQMAAERNQTAAERNQTATNNPRMATVGEQASPDCLQICPVDTLELSFNARTGWAISRMRAGCRQRGSAGRPGQAAGRMSRRSGATTASFARQALTAVPRNAATDRFSPTSPGKNRRSFNRAQRLRPAVVVEKRAGQAIAA